MTCKTAACIRKSGHKGKHRAKNGYEFSQHPGFVKEGKA